jgi:hypothetical protein
MLFRNSRRVFILRKADMIQAIVVIVEREEEIEDKKLAQALVV